MLPWGKDRDVLWDRAGGPDLRYGGEVGEAKCGQIEG